MAVETGEPLQQRTPVSARTRRRRLVSAAVVLAACAGLFWCYLRLSATYPSGSDAASNALEAWDLLHGNWLLHGWTLTDVSFYTTELPEFAAVELVRGLNPGAVHATAAPHLHAARRGRRAAGAGPGPRRRRAGPGP